ncbi:MAG: SBBP repeat-containing protein, partial [Patescibacteria group bacterium]
MKRRLQPLVLIALVVALTLNLNQHFEIRKDQAASSSVQAQFAQLPLAFEPNVGQAGSVVQYLVHHGQATTYFAGSDTVTTVGEDRLTMRLAGTTTPAFTGTDELSSKTNYFLGSDQSKWQTGVANFQTIIAENVYPGIDLKYYGSDAQLEHDFIVSPGADPAQIGLEFAGHKELMLDAGGNLTLKLAHTELTLEAPVSYQETAVGGRKAVDSSFTLDGQKVRIALGEYDTTRPLVIDPTLIYSTYLGGSSDEFGRKIAIDSSGNAYVGGQTKSSDFPTSSPYQGTFGGTEDAFVTKMNAAGTALIYSTYVGGTGTDQAIGLTIDSSGNAYIVGNTDSTDYPTVSPYQAANGGTQDVFVTKL